MALGSNLTKTQTSIKKGLSRQDHDDNLKISDKGNVFSEILANQNAGQNKLKEEHDPISLYIIFKVAQENYTLPVKLIDEVVPITDIAAIPQVPDYIKGMVNVRGEVYAVIDLALKYKLRKIESEFEPNYFITIKSDNYKIALAIEQLAVTIDVKASELSSTASLGQDEIGKDHVIGVIKKENKMLICLDIDQLVKDLDM
jgi:purine-binding chemotaxis protein CheW